jgi:hypothetical protein
MWFCTATMKFQTTKILEFFKSEKYKKKNTRAKMGVVQRYLKGRIPQENLVFCWNSVKYKKKKTQEFKVGVVQSYLKGRIP